jgi:hypothetical protein
LHHSSKKKKPLSRDKNSDFFGLIIPFCVAKIQNKLFTNTFLFFDTMYNINVNLTELIVERIALLEVNLLKLKEQLAEAKERNKILESTNSIANIRQNLN